MKLQSLSNIIVKQSHVVLFLNNTNNPVIEGYLSTLVAYNDLRCIFTGNPFVDFNTNSQVNCGVCVVFPGNSSKLRSIFVTIDFMINMAMVFPTERTQLLTYFLDYLL